MFHLGVGFTQCGGTPAVAAATAPAQFGTGDWTLTDPQSDGDLTLTISALPSDGGSAITALQYSLNAGSSWTTMSGTGTGARTISGLANDASQAVIIRAVNAVGNGTASASKSATPTTAVVANTLGVFGFSVPDDRISNADPGMSTEFSTLYGIGERLQRVDARHSYYIANGHMNLLDSIVSAATTAGVTMVGCIGAATDLSDSTERADYVSFCGYLANRYPQILKWTLTNEPNMSGSTLVLRANYALMVDAAVAAIKAQNPDATVGIGELAGIENDSGSFQGTDEFVQAIYDGSSDFDEIWLHSYTDSATIGWDNASDTANWHTKKIVLTNIPAIMTAEGDLDRQIYIGETGMHTHGAGFTEAWQALWFRQQMRDFLLATNIEHVLWHTSYDLASPTTGAQDAYGAWKSSGASNAPKRVVHEMAEVAGLWAATTPPITFTKGGGDKQHPIFRKVRDKTSPRRRNLTWSAGSLPTGVSVNSTTGILTITDASVSVQTATACSVIATHSTGATLTVNFTLTVYNPNLLAAQSKAYDFLTSGGITGWNILNANSAVAYDSALGALKVTINGSGAGVVSDALTVVGSTLYEVGMRVNKGTYGGTLLNVFMDGVAADTATVTVPTSGWGWVTWRHTQTAADTSATVAFSRNGSFTGDIYIADAYVRAV